MKTALRIFKAILNKKKNQKLRIIVTEHGKENSVIYKDIKYKNHHEVQTSCVFLFFFLLPKQCCHIQEDQQLRNIHQG